MIRILSRHSLTKYSPEDALEGLLFLVNKPLDWTSFDAVNKTRYLLKRRLHVNKLKVGHAGTLDPQATGLLILCAGPYTKMIDDYQGMDKRYSGTITIGGTTASYDRETPVENELPWEHLDTPAFEEARDLFVGEIEQIPPMYSAIKVDGVRAYRLARKGDESTVLKSRSVIIRDFNIQLDQLPEIPFSVKCTKGTYIRSLAHDFGKALGVGGWLSSLHRDAIGTFECRDAISIEELMEWAKPID
jgi:tRNA pseudouridine55 synthase